jgi:energy-coupling factor transport system substrate-specific component
MMTDYQGNLWFTSSRQGVMKIVRNRFLDIFEKYGLEPAVVNTTCKQLSQLYIGTDAGLIIIDESRGERVNNELSAMLSEARIRSIEKDSRGSIWISTFSPECLVRYSDGAIRSFTTGDGLPSERIRSVSETKDGRILVACTGGVAVIEGDSVKKVYNDKDGLANTEILTVAEADNGDLVFGSDGDGLYIIHDGKTLHIGTEDGLTSDVVMRVKKDRSRDILWLVTSNSIAYLDNDNKVVNIHKFPYSNNFDLYQNSRDEMWVLSSNGIYQVPTSEMLENKEISPLFYDTDNGLSCIATANSYSELTKDGDLYIAGNTGVSKVNMASLSL